MNAVKTIAIQLPASEEAFGRWLEEKHGRVEIVSMLGRYALTITLHHLESYKDEGNTSIRVSREIEIAVHAATIAEAMSEAMRIADAQKARGS